MDREVIETKLESLRHCVQRISDKCPSTPEQLMTDPDLQDIITLNLTRAVQLCVDIGAHLVSGLDTSPPDTMGGVFDTLAKTGIVPEELALKLKKSVGFRNIAVHHYKDIDWHIVYIIARDHLEDFTNFARIITTRL